ncbi:MAG: transposase [Deltaproteobacteria bacterium]|nr:transposase [Deltaproteobacteria bacterium]
MSKKARQLEMFEKSPTRHGGKHSVGKRKKYRPIATKKSMHLVLRASKAIGTRSMLSRAHAERIRAVIDAAAAQNHVAVAQFANVGNHLHLLIRAKTRDGFKNFLRTVTARIAILVTGAVKGRPFGKFWDHLAFSRIVEWGRDLIGTREYLTKNQFEGEGIELMTSDGPRIFQIRRGTLRRT